MPPEVTTLPPFVEATNMLLSMLTDSTYSRSPFSPSQVHTHPPVCPEMMFPSEATAIDARNPHPGPVVEK